MRRPRLRGAIETVDGGIVDFTYPSGPCRSQPSSRRNQREQRPARWGWQDGQHLLLVKQKTLVSYHTTITIGRSGGNKMEIAYGGRRR
jgi:hypothetical protein